MNSKQKEAFKGLVAELREVIPQEDRSKLGQLERIVGELRRERGELSTKVAELASLRDATKVVTAKAESAAEKRIATMQQGFAQTESKLRGQIAERNDIITSLSQRNGEFHAGLYPIATDTLWITKEQLIRANDESIRLGFNRNIEEEYLASLPDQDYLIMQAFYHVGFSGRPFEQLNYRLILSLCSKLASPRITEADMEHVVLDVPADLWDELRTQGVHVRMNCNEPQPGRNLSNRASA